MMKMIFVKSYSIISVMKVIRLKLQHSAEEALKRPLGNLDLVLLDVMMGPMSGFKFADKLRKELKT